MSARLSLSLGLGLRRHGPDCLFFNSLMDYLRNPLTARVRLSDESHGESGLGLVATRHTHGDPAVSSPELQQRKGGLVVRLNTIIISIGGAACNLGL